MNRLVIIGNGFDLAHALKTNYKDFMCWLINKYLDQLLKNRDYTDIKNHLFELATKHDYYLRVAYNDMRDNGTFRRDEPLKFLSETEGITVKKSPLFERIIQNIETKGWTDIESDYYSLLKENANNIENCKKLNCQLDFLREELIEFLNELKKIDNRIEGITNALKEDVAQNDIAKSSRNLFYERGIDNSQNIKVSKLQLLNFNYTHTVEEYKEEVNNIAVNYIHGSLANPNQIIFGYGDEMDKDFQELIDRNENELLKHSKSVKYLETKHYRNLLDFIESDLFQVYIMGHSCGISDRTLLNTIFEHSNCISIKPFCFINEGEDNYSELTMNIYRNFTDKKLFRDRVVNKEQCSTLDGKPLVKKNERD